MRLTIPLGKGIPIEISEEKIPALFEKLVPQLMKHMGDLQTMGVDLTPMVRKMFGASEPTPVIASATSSAPTTTIDDDIAKVKAAGYWQSEVDSKWYPPHLAPRAHVVEPQLRVCGTCVRGNSATNQPLAPFNPPCNTCQFDAARASYMTKP